MAETAETVRRSTGLPWHIANLEPLAEADFADLDELAEAANDAIAGASGYRIIGPVAVTWDVADDPTPDE